MTSGTPRLSEVARYVIQPEGIVSTGWPAVRDTCARLGIEFDTWQDGAGRLILAKREDGLYASDTVAISIPRQVGKTYLIGAIAFALCLIVPGLTVIWTAHRFKTAKETFTSMKGMARRQAVKPYIARVFQGSGEEAILFTNGSRVLFGARENGFGLGFTNVGVLVLDEAQRLTSRAMDDLIPTTNAAANPLILMTGTPPRPQDPGEIFTLLRQEALDGESDGTLYIEFSADRGCDPRDTEQWKKANASFPHRTSARAILRMLKSLSLDSFYREGLGIWDEINRHQAVVRGGRWTDMAGEGPAEGTKPSALGVDMSHSRQISIAACWMVGERAHLEEVWAGVDEAAAAAWIVARAGRRIPVVIDNASPAASLSPVLRARKVKVQSTSAQDMAKACGMFVSRARPERLSHAGQESLNAALAGGRKRAIGTAGGWGWDRTDESVDISPIVAATLALFGAESTKRRGSGGASFA